MLWQRNKYRECDETGLGLIRCDFLSFRGVQLSHTKNSIFCCANLYCCSQVDDLREACKTRAVLAIIMAGEPQEQMTQAL